MLEIARYSAPSCLGVLSLCYATFVHCWDLNRDRQTEMGEVGSSKVILDKMVSYTPQPPKKINL